MRYTKNYKLKQPEADDYVLVEDFNENSDTVDELIKKIESVIGDLENSEEKESLIKLIEKLQSNKADLGKDGKVVPEQLPEVDLSGIENSITELESNALKLGETETTALDGYRGMIAFNHAKSKHADPNAITENKAKELLEEFTQMTRVKADESRSYIDLVKIKNTVFATLNSISNGSFNCTIPVGFRPKSDYKTYIPYEGGQYGKTSIGVSTTGKVTRNLNTTNDLWAVSGSTISWEA